MTVVLAVLGAALVGLAWLSVLAGLVVPRRTRDPLTRGVTLTVDWAFRLVTSRIHRYRARDRVLAGEAAVILLAQLVVWLGFFYLGFALLIHGVGGRGIGNAFAQAGSSLFTLGYAGPDTASLSFIDYLAAATGLIVVALQIGYLPTLYSAFNRRETEVTLLSSRAGTPAWGPEILARTRFGVGEADAGALMDQFYLDWERWAADVSESHSNYPVLMRFRSPAKYSSWVVALVAVMDSAALWLALSPSRAPMHEARLCLRMGFTALQEIAGTVGIPVNRNPDPDEELLLTYADYLVGIERIKSTTFVMDRSPEEAWPDFRGWRVNYEAAAYALARRLDVVPAPWTGARRTGDTTVAPHRPPNRHPTPYVPPPTE
ncbi:MAG: hypothetical protein ABIZ07_09505 [Dermatophilaceae bacterium]